MKIDDIFASFYKGDWEKLDVILKKQISRYAESGDVVSLSRAFSYYGALNLLNGNNFLVSTLFKQISEEYTEMGDDPRINASYARFLALYHSFSGLTEAASKYYREARLFYQQTDWYRDEAIALLESLYWYYLFTDDYSEMYSIIGRLERLNSYLERYLDNDLTVLKSIISGEITSLCELERKTMPWYKKQFVKLESRFRDTKSKKDIHKETDRISISLFDKCLITCKSSGVSLDAFKAGLGKELLLYIATRNNLQEHREALQELFFSGEDVERSNNRLYVNIHRMNRALQEYFETLKGSSFIFIKQGVVYINTDVLEEVDTHKYRKIMSVANQLWMNDKEAAIELISRAVTMYSDNIAPGFYYLDWLEDYRIELKNMQIKALYRLFRYYKSKCDSAACTAAFYDLIGLDSLNEEYYIEYINFILSEGRNTEAINLYHQYETRLKNELGLSVSSRLKGLLTCINEVEL